MEVVRPASNIRTDTSGRTAHLQARVGMSQYWFSPSATFECQRTCDLRVCICQNICQQLLRSCRTPTATPNGILLSRATSQRVGAGRWQRHPDQRLGFPHSLSLHLHLRSFACFRAALLFLRSFSSGALSKLDFALFTCTAWIPLHNSHFLNSRPPFDSPSSAPSHRSHYQLST